MKQKLKLFMKQKQDKQQNDKEIKELKVQIEDLTNKWKRALADYQNLEKNAAEQKKQWIDWAGSDLILKLLPVLENLQKAAEHLKDQGLSLTVNQLQKILEEERLQVVKIESGKDKFTPEYMECIEFRKGEDNIILEIAEQGYYLKGKLLKPAKVVVGKK